MFDKLESIVKRYEEVLEELNSPSVASDQNNFRKLMKEQSDLTPIVEAYKQYKNAKQTIEDSLEMLEENDEEIREMVRKCSRDGKATQGSFKVLYPEDMEAIYKMAR